MALAAAADLDCEEDDWELCNDDGFVYKRKRRPLGYQKLITAAPLEDPTAEEKLRRNRRRITLLRLRDKYQREALQWEDMSNSLRTLENGTEGLETLENGESEEANEEEGVQEPSDSRRNVCGSLIDELMVQAEVEEAFIEDASSICEMAEIICEEEEERFRRYLLDLQVWEPTPRDIMLSLCHED